MRGHVLLQVRGHAEPLRGHAEPLRGVTMPTFMPETG